MFRPHFPQDHAPPLPPTQHQPCDRYSGQNVTIHTPPSVTEAVPKAWRTKSLITSFLGYRVQIWRARSAGSSPSPTVHNSDSASTRDDSCLTIMAPCNATRETQWAHPCFPWKLSLPGSAMCARCYAPSFIRQKTQPPGQAWRIPQVRLCECTPKLVLASSFPRLRSRSRIESRSH